MTVPLPKGTVLLHIGHPKSGSTALQTALVRERAALPALGAAYPGVSRRNAEAGRVVMGLGTPIGLPPPPADAWDVLCAEVAAAPELRVCVSNEDFARAAADRIGDIVAGLGGDRVHVLLSVRRLDRALPSQWQERIKAREVVTYDEWLGEMLHDPTAGRPRNSPWVNELGGLIRRWVDVVGPQRCTVLVGDEDDHDLQPRTFERLLGLPEGQLRPETQRSNRGLTRNETELLRAINQHFVGNGWSGEQYRRLIQSGFVAALTRRARSETDAPLPPLPDWAHHRATELSEQRVRDLADLGVGVIGDPEGLRVPPREQVVEPPDPPPEEVGIGVAAAAVEGLLAAAVRRETRLDERRRRAVSRLRRVRRREAPPSEPQLDSVPASALVTELRRRAVRRLRARRLRARG